VRRLFWVALGAAAGVLTVRKINQVAQSYTPEGVGRSLSSLAEAVREMADVVREGMAEREQELRLALGVEAGEIDPAAAADLLENPSGRHRQD
jgi:hypothetical protein